MIIGVPKEIKPSEHRVGITPSTASRLIEENHTVLVQKSSGEGIGATDDDYIKVGVKVVDGPEEIFKNSNMIVKVKEPFHLPSFSCRSRTSKRLNRCKVPRNCI